MIFTTVISIETAQVHSELSTVHEHIQNTMQHNCNINNGNCVKFSMKKQNLSFTQRSADRRTTYQYSHGLHYFHLTLL